MIPDTFRSAYRALTATRGLSLAAIFSIAIGIGGNVTIFSLWNAVVLRPLDYPDPDQLVSVTERNPFARGPYEFLGVAPIQFARWRKELASFDSLSVAFKDLANLSGDGLPETLGAVRVSAGFFETLRVRPQLGRWFYEWEERRGAPDVVILSDSLWRRRFSASPSVVGRTIVLGGVPHLVIGVAGPDAWLFRGRQLHPSLDFPDRVDVFLPLRMTPREEKGEPKHAWLGIGRLRPGASPAQARAEAELTNQTFLYENDERLDFQVLVEPLQSVAAGPARKPFSVLLAAVGFVLLIVCVNVANLLLVRGAGRRREFAIRVALGAGRWNLVAGSLAESLLLSGAGLMVGLALAAWIMPAVIAWAPADIARIDRAGFDTTVLLFGVLLTLLTTVIFGLLPAWRSSLFSPAEFLRAAGRTATEGPRGARLRAVLVGFEAALATVLLVGAGLFLLSLHRVLHVEKGFQVEQVLSADMALPLLRYRSYPAQFDFIRRLREGIAPLSGVSAVAAISVVPLGNDDNVSPAVREGLERLPIGEHPLAWWSSVTADYFTAMNIPLRAGRTFHDEQETELVAVVSEKAARILWPGEYPIGRRIHHWYAPKSAWPRVIGVVGDVRARSLDQDPSPVIYRPYSQRAGETFSLIVRTARPPAEMRALIREQVSRVDSEVPVDAVRTMSEIVSGSVAGRRMQAVLIGAFAAVAMLLAAVGVYGVVAWSVVSRRREIAVRLALGASQGQIRSLIFRHGMAPVLLGLAVGVVAAGFASGLIRALLFNVAPFDPIAFSVAPLILALAGLLPCLRAGQHAARTEPSLALQGD